MNSQETRKKQKWDRVVRLLQLRFRTDSDKILDWILLPRKVFGNKSAEYLLNNGSPDIVIGRLEEALNDRPRARGAQ